MGGEPKTSTHDVTANAPRSPFSKLKTLGNASAATPTGSGHLQVALLKMIMQCCSTCLAKGTTQTKEQVRRYSAIANRGLASEEMAAMN